MSSRKCGLKYIFMSIIFIAIVNGYAKDISGVERDHVRLNEYISHYERLDYDHLNVRASHHRARRSVTKDHYVHLKFQAHGQDFHIRLKRDLHTFSDKLEIIDSNNAPLNILTDHIYVGNVIGDRNSYVFGSILDGIFEGKIITARDVYYVEHAKRYFPANFTQSKAASFKQTEEQELEAEVERETEAVAIEEFVNSTSTTATTTTKSTTAATTLSSSPTSASLETTTTTTTTAVKTARRSLESLSSPLKKSLTDYHDDTIKTIGFHSVIYKDSHVHDAYEHIRDEGHIGGCGITEEVSQWMENIQNSAVEELPEPMSKDVEKIAKKRTISTAPTITTTTTATTTRAAATTKATSTAETIDTTEATMITLRPDKSYYNDKIVHQANDDDDDDNDNDNGDDVYVDDYNKKNVHEKEIRKTELLFHNDQQNIMTTISTITTTASSSIITKNATSINSNRNNTDKLRVVELLKQQQQHQQLQQQQQQRILSTTHHNTTQTITMQSPNKYEANKSHAYNDDNVNPGAGATDAIDAIDDAVDLEDDDDDDKVDDDNHFKYSRPYQKYTKDANIFNGNGYFYNPETGARYAPNEWHEHIHERMKRASGSSPLLGNAAASRAREDNKNTCSLYIQTDPLIWRHIREGIADHDRSHKYERDIKTREEITSLIAHHVTAVNYIYRNTKFDGRTEHRNIRFEVQRIKIDDDSACRSSYNGPHNAFCNEHMDVSNFLNLHSLEDHSDFCLAYVFTYRDFSGGTLGLAWVASASGASGGICEKYKTYTETVGGQYQSTKRSLNTGIITFVNYNSRVPPKVSQLTLAHEIGHNFGSPHDYPQECRPGGLNGNFIMFASATSGDRPNNSKFSSCSIRNISHVLDVLVGNMKRDCFQVSEGAFCGNKIVEQGEECDCGFNEDECKDNCCYPRLISEYDMSLNSSAKGCTRRAKTQCSPSQGPCCLSNSCTFVPAHYQQKCKEETECSWLSICNGTTAECPEPKPREDKTKCNNGTALCIDGECSGSICLLWNMSECFLTSQITPHVDKRKLCELACQNGNDTGTCRSTSEFAHLYGLPVGGISLRPGSPCDNFQGYCDVFLKCRAVDADGPLVRLKNLLLNRETLLTVAQWVTENWYIVVLMGIAFIIVMGAFIKCCAVHTPSSNPKKRRARRISETLRAPMNTLRRMRHPHSRSAGGARSIPPPVHEGRSQHRNYPPEWDRAQRSGASRSTAGAGGRSVSASASRNIRGNASRQSNAARPSVGGHGYADGSVSGVGSGASIGGIMPTGLGPNNNGGGGVGGSGSSVHLTASAAVTGAANTGASRSQLPLPALPSNVHQQQQQLPQQSYYAPKVEVRNKSRSSRSSSTQLSKSSNNKQATTTTKRTSSPTKHRNQTKEHKMQNQKSGNNNKIRRNIVY